ncbi:MAG: class I SAM-dependent methyltransferase [Clostridiales bacterium]|nr:class I SAM-dependent methyltransferase [Clostridiales bacterium]
MSENVRWNESLWKDADFWDKEWQEAKKQSLYSRRRKDMNEAEWWSRRAPGYSGRDAAAGGFAGAESDSKVKRSAEILRMLINSEFVDSTADLLDIGCGPGSYSIPLAGRFRKVVALDPSEGMLSILRERAASMGITNIETVCMNWNEADLQKLGWNRRFGLVMAMKTPGIDGAEALKKMNEASCGGCFYNGFIKRDDRIQQELWRLFFKEDKPPVPAEVFYVFHMLFAWGYIPDMKLFSSIQVRRMNEEEALEELMLMMMPYSGLPEDTEDILRAYIQKRMTDGVLTQLRDVTEGDVLWKAT